MASYNKFQVFVGDLGNGVHDLNDDAIKVYLTNATPDAAADNVKADLAEIAAGNGYTAGGEDIAATYAEVGGVGTLAGTDVVITAAGGSIGPFRYVVLYNDTPAGDPLNAWWDYGSALTLNDGDSFTIDFGASIATVT